MNNTGETTGRLFKMCTEISDICTVERTVLGYYPNFGANAFFAAAFLLIAVVSGGLGVWKRTWTFTVTVTGGTALEGVGYVGRMMLNKNPWDSGAFQMQICAIILGPTFICVGIYLTLKHVTLNLNPNLSRIRPRLYPWIFLPADMSCLVVQAIGGGLAGAAGNKNPKLLQGGNRAIIAGVALQVVVLLAFGVLGVDYWVRLRKWVRAVDAAGGVLEGEDEEMTRRAMKLYREPRFRKFSYAIAGAFAAILTRCIYRIAEMAGGWGNHIMQDEISFIILDSVLILVAVTLLTVFHPGLFFPAMATGAKRKGGEESVTGGDTTPELVDTRAGNKETF
ncbi:RTA1 like protein [Plectosphaerella cucumerina]|uniref:RTA1 like protein n=1 Tax=Plectosphaerella cucumerina TaxID=40658 RepID=A0A8K0TLT1_9PEZI|nr:RTA1 like protein [Plectosphaerella cucumerina]